MWDHMVLLKKLRFLWKYNSAAEMFSIQFKYVAMDLKTDFQLDS